MDPSAPESLSLSGDSGFTVPCFALSGCVRAFVSRDTRGRAMRPEERYNHFPAGPMCALAWRLSGEAFRLDGPHGEPQALSEPLPAITFIGPSDRPALTWNPGPVHMFAVVLLPDAWHALTGLPLAHWVNCRVPVEALLDGDWLALCESVQAASDDTQRVALMEAFLLPRWRAAQSSGAVPVRRTHDWLLGLATRAALTGWGRSMRQAERRVRRWVGLSMGELRRFSRAEQLLAGVSRTDADGSPRWAEEARRLGFSDQAHMCRETRRLSGHSPAGLHRALHRDEALWFYRAWLQQQDWAEPDGRAAVARADATPSESGPTADGEAP